MLLLEQRRPRVVVERRPRAPRRPRARRSSSSVGTITSIVTSRSPPRLPFSPCVGVAGHALTAHAHHLAVRRAGRDPHRHLTVEGRHLHVGAERRFRERDRQPDRDVVAAATEQRVRLHTHDHEQVAGRSAVRAGRAASLHADALPVGDARRNAHLHFTCAHLDPAALARRARRGDDLTAPTTRGAHLRERERALIDRDRSAAATLGTRLGLRAGRRARTATRGAGRVGTEPHRARDAAHGVVERQVQLGLEILAALRPLRRRAGPDRHRGCRAGCRAGR